MRTSLLSGVVCLLMLVTASTAQAQGAPGELAYSPAAPVVGESVTFTSGFITECNGGGRSFTFTVDGVARAAQTTTSITVSFSTAGTHTVSVAARETGDGCTRTGTESASPDIRPALTGTIALTPDPVIRSRPVTIDVTPGGGTPGYTYAWDSDNDGAFDDETEFEFQKTYTTLGPRTVRVRIRDNAPNQHEAIVSRTFNVTDPPAGSPPPPPVPATPPPCRKAVAFELSQFTTTGCFTQTGTGFTTRSPVKLNGIAFPSFGQTFTITAPDGVDKGGRFTAPSSTIQLEGLNVYSGDIDWALPAADGTNGGAGTRKLLKEIKVALGAQVFGLNVKGTVGILLGRDADGTHFARFPLKVEFPAGIETGPNQGYSRATGETALRVDAQKVHFDGLRLQAENVWIGKVKLVEACFSFVPAGGESAAQCPAPKLRGEEYVKCEEDTTVDRWDGNAVVQLPVGAKTQVGAFGGVAGGELSKLGGFVDELGRAVPIGPNVFLNSVGVGLCLKPSFQIRGTFGVGLFPTTKGETVGVNGDFIYDDGGSGRSWKFTVTASVSVFGTPVGSGSVTIRPYGGIDFDFKAGFDVSGIVSLNGQISGWSDYADQFYVSGSLKACVGGSICAEGSGVISHIGVAGCVTIVSTLPSPDLRITFNPLRARWAESTTYIRAGFGYSWATRDIKLFAASCDFAPYTPVRNLARAAGGGLMQTVERGTNAVSWRIHGTDGPPKVVIRGPGGTTITSPTDGISKELKGKFMLVENKLDGTTNVVLIQPPAGAWTVSAAPGAASTPTRIDEAESELRPELEGRVRASGDVRELDLGYAIPKGTSVRLVERAAGISRTITPSVVGRRCPNSPTMRPGSDQQLLCAKVRFRPSRGPGGTRKVIAVVSRKSVPIMDQTVGTFRAPAQTRPSRVGVLRAHRANGFVVVAFPRSRGASRYAVSATLTDGRSVGFDLDPKCEQVQIANVPRDVGATVTVAGVRYDMVGGAKRSITIKAGATDAGRKSKVPRNQWRTQRACR